METVVVFGGSGLLGSTLVKRLQSCYSVIAYSRNVFDVSKNTDMESIRRFLDGTHPKYVINCSGVLVKEAEQHPELATIVNTLFPMNMGRACIERGIKFIHFSTNCVFSGDDNNSYFSWDTPNSMEPYGISKAGGESENYITIRTSFIGHSPRRNDTGLFNWFLTSPDKIQGYDVVWNGVSTLDIADYIFMFLSLENGIYHFADSVGISKFDLLNICNDVYGFEKDIELVHGGGNSKMLIPSWDMHFPSWELRIERIKGEMERSWI